MVKQQDDEPAREAPAPRAEPAHREPPKPRAPVDAIHRVNERIAVVYRIPHDRPYKDDGSLADDVVKIRVWLARQ